MSRWPLLLKKIDGKGREKIKRATPRRMAGTAEAVEPLQSLANGLGVAPTIKVVVVKLAFNLFGRG